PQVVDEGPAHAPRQLAVDLLRVDPADVVGLEYRRVDHGISLSRSPGEVRDHRAFSEDGATPNDRVLPHADALGQKRALHPGARSDLHAAPEDRVTDQGALADADATHERDVRAEAGPRRQPAPGPHVERAL